MKKIKEIAERIKQTSSVVISKLKDFFKKAFKETSAFFEICAIYIGKAFAAVKKFFGKLSRETKALFEIIGYGISTAFGAVKKFFKRIGGAISRAASAVAKAFRRVCEAATSLYRKYKNYILPALIVITGALYILASLIIFFTGGDKPYSHKSVGAHLIWLSVPSVLTVIAAVVTGVRALKSDKGEERIKLDTTERAYRLVSRMTLGIEISEEGNKKLEYERKIRRDVVLMAIAATLVTSVISLIIILNPDMYTIENLNNDIISATLTATPAIAVGLGSAVFAKQVQLASLARATAVIKDEIKAVGKVQKQDSVMHSESVPNRIFTGGVRVLVIALALVFIIMGIANGGMADVLSKAVKICTECIGLG